MENHPCFQPPRNVNKKLWRYMDFTKFISFLENSALFFSRADKFVDHLEGSLPLGNREKRNNDRAEMMPLCNNDEKFVNQVLSSRSSTREQQRLWQMINCWHMNNKESAAMWSLYGQSNRSIAIQTTYKKLCRNLDGCVYTGIVNYIDYTKPYTTISEDNYFIPFLHKHKSFEHEHELRAIIWYYQDFNEKYHEDQRKLFDDAVKKGKTDVRDEFKKLQSENEKAFVDYQQNFSGIMKKVNIEDLVEKIYVSPNSEKWFSDLVKKLVEDNYKLKIPIHMSEMDVEPFF